MLFFVIMIYKQIVISHMFKQRGHWLFRRSNPVQLPTGMSPLLVVLFRTPAYGTLFCLPVRLGFYARSEGAFHASECCLETGRQHTGCRLGDEVAGSDAAKRQAVPTSTIGSDDKARSWTLSR